MQFIVCNINLRAHVDSKSLRESCEVNVTFLLRIKYILHQRGNFFLCNINLVGEQVLLEIFIGNETISIFVEFPEDLVHLVFTIKNAVFDLTHDRSESACFTFIFSSS